jgi:hypothetical protein
VGRILGFNLGHYSIVLKNGIFLSQTASSTLAIKKPCAFLFLTVFFLHQICSNGLQSMSYFIDVMQSIIGKSYQEAVVLNSFWEISKESDGGCKLFSNYFQLYFGPLVVQIDN